MNYKINYEPMYATESRHILEKVVNGTSIKTEMEESIENRKAEALRKQVEEIYKIPLQLEQHLKENICLNLPGYEKTGTTMAGFLYKSWGLGTGNAVAATTPIDAIVIYDLMQSMGLDSKAGAIIYTIDTEYMFENIYSLSDLEAGKEVPVINDKALFGHINNTHLEPQEKINALKLYHEFDQYRAYAHTLTKHAEELLKPKISEYTNEIKAHMDTLEKKWLTNGGTYVKDMFGLGKNDDKQLYHIYPGAYLVAACSLNMPVRKEPSIIVGMGAISLTELYDNAETNNEKAAQFLKCLSDGTKQAILQLLKEEPMYGGQLAEKLNCSSANISQHMSVLSNLGVVRYKKDNNRMYFVLDKDVIHRYLDLAKGLFG